MNDITTFALMFEILKRMESELYHDVTAFDAVLTDMPKEDTMGLYFELEEYIMAYKELIEERRHEQG